MTSRKLRGVGAIALITALVGLTASAAPPLTLIQDTLYKADGTAFEGVAFVQWKSFEAADTSSIQMQSFTARIVNGALRVQLVPTTDASPGAYYLIKYNSNGRTQFVEYWSVPPSSVALRLRDVRLAAPPGADSSSPPVNTAILIPDIAGLRQELDVRPSKGVGYANSRTAIINSDGSLESALGTLSDCVHVDGTAGACGASGTASNITYVDAENPSGAVDGANSTFTLSASPTPSISLQMYRNGILQKQGPDYSVSGNVISVAGPSIPGAGDVLQTWYRVTVASGSISFSDSETPSGAVNGSNAAFVLVGIPNPIASLQLFRNGILQRTGVDYSNTGSSITFLSNSIPQTGDIVQAYYRY